MDFQRDVELAAKRIGDRVRRTPVERSRGLANGGAGTVWLKLENLQLTGSFKLRGATNKILSLGDDERRRGIVAASSGNHGAAVACAAAATGCRAIVYVPKGAASSKVAAIGSWGAEVRTHGADCVLAEAEARRFGESEGMVYVSPYNDPLVVAGQGTLGLELGEQVASASEQLDAIFISMGGGGLISGVGGYLKTVWPELRVVACSPENSCVMHTSLEVGKVVEQESLPTLSDGTAGGIELDSITFELCQEVVDESVLLSEEAIGDALRLLIAQHHTLVEGAAGVAVAAYLNQRERFANQNVGIVLCGANIDSRVLKDIL